MQAYIDLFVSIVYEYLGAFLGLFVMMFLLSLVGYGIFYFANLITKIIEENK